MACFTPWVISLSLRGSGRWEKNEKKRRSWNCRKVSSWSASERPAAALSWLCSQSITPPTHFCLTPLPGRSFVWLMSEEGTITAFTKANFTERQLLNRNCHSEHWVVRKKKKIMKTKQKCRNGVKIISMEKWIRGRNSLKLTEKNKNNSPDGMFHESIKFHYHNCLSPWNVFCKTVRQGCFIHWINK